jgi:transposase
MSWRASSVHHERQEFVCLAEQEGDCFSQLCLRFGISRKTGYKWRERAHQGGGLQDMSCKPHHSPKQSTPAVEAAVLESRDRHPAWGGRKIAHVLKRDRGLEVTPSPVTHILHRHQRILPARSATATPWERFEHEAPVVADGFQGTFCPAPGTLPSLDRAR